MPQQLCKYCYASEPTSRLFELPICEDCRSAYQEGDQRQKIWFAQIAFWQVMLQAIAASVTSPRDTASGPNPFAL